MSYSLYLSADGWPPEDSKRNWIICRDFDTAIEYVERNFPETIFFGEELRSVPDCLDFANWLIRYDATEDILLKDFEYEVEKGDFAVDIARVMRNYLRKKFG